MTNLDQNLPLPADHRQHVCVSEQREHAHMDPGAEQGYISLLIIIHLHQGAVVQSTVLPGWDTWHSMPEAALPKHTQPNATSALKGGTRKLLWLRQTQPQHRREAAQTQVRLRPLKAQGVTWGGSFLHCQEHFQCPNTPRPLGGRSRR